MPLPPSLPIVAPASDFDVVPISERPLLHSKPQPQLTLATRIRLTGGNHTEVQISVHEIDEAQDDFVVLASDGLWDHVSNAEAVEIVRNAAYVDGEPEAAGDRLIMVSGKSRHGRLPEAFLL